MAISDQKTKGKFKGKKTAKDISGNNSEEIVVDLTPRFSPTMNGVFFYDYQENDKENPNKWTAVFSLDSGRIL